MGIAALVTVEGRELRGSLTLQEARVEDGDVLQAGTLDRDGWGRGGRSGRDGRGARLL